MTIRTVALSKRYGPTTVLDKVSFDVGAGELVALLGPSGGGKSTILRLIAGLDPADSGEVWLDGRRMDHLEARERGVGFVFQHYALFRHQTIAENVAFGLRVRGVDAKARRARASELLQLVGLPGLEDRFPDQLSGGQRQRVALARALAPKPSLLLLDEPFGAVDAKVREELRRWLRQLHDEVHTTSIFVTHDQEEAFAVADRVLIVRDGVVEQIGSPAQILDTPATEFVSRFVGDVNVLDGRCVGRAVDLAGVVVAAPEVADGPARVVIRAYDLKMWVDVDGPAEVRRLVTLGDRVRVETRLRDGRTVMALFPRRSSLLTGMVPGARVAVEVTRAWVWPG